MPGKKTKTECCDGVYCSPPMSSACLLFGSLMVVLAGIALLVGAFSQFDATTIYITAGFLLVLHGLGGVLHSFAACPMCKPK